MMDHARHLSSPSPTSPFLFHHSERSFKSNPLTPLLSSTADVTSVDDCFSTNSTNISNQNHHNPFGIDHHHHHLLVDNHHHQRTSHQRHNDQCVIDQHSLTGVDDDDGMHNMISGSSTSSTSTMPLLTENHSHHSFSRISLEEYSPLSLVEDCDNALPISPTSLACGSHHSFKSSMNGLKMENLVGDVDHDVNDDVNDARSLSPSLLSSSDNNHHHNLWSTSSTAITQNSSLLNGSSSSFLLSQHQQQLNSLIQQLEPQSLDEPPPLVSSNSDTSLAQSGLASMNRPSSEPPPGSGIELSDIESKSLNCQPLQPNKCKQTKVKKGAGKSSATPALAPRKTPSRPRRNRNRSGASKQQTTGLDKTALGEAAKLSSPTSSSSFSATVHQPAENSSKVHLQLNHHKKLEELQKRLFGASAPGGLDKADSASINQEVKAPDNLNGSSDLTSVKSEPVLANGIKQEPDSSATNNGNNKDDIAPTNNQATVKTRTRPTRIRRSRAKSANDTTCDPSSSTNQSSSSGNKQAQKGVTAETAEPDTTTISSDCIKLADLLANSNNNNGDNKSYVINGFSSNSETSESDNGEKRVQQIQLQVSPSLTVVANGGIMQPISIQQQSQTMNTSSTNTTFASQIICRPQTVMTTAGGQLKGMIATNSDLFKGGETVLSNWSLQAANNNTTGQANNGSNNTATLTNGQTISGHQIAIQVICQDGTSLVLPVSSTVGLNAAVSLTSQHQQLQAVLANNANQQRNGSNNNNNQMLPPVSVTNIVAQQQTNTGDSKDSLIETTATTTTTTTTTSTGAHSAQISGLAASSPTLAALLDAGSNRASNTDLSNTNNFSGQNFMPTNLLRKLVCSNTNGLKRGELTLTQGPTLSLTGCGSLVTVCTPGSNNSNKLGSTNDTNSNNSSQSKTNPCVNNSNNNSGEKRIKLENAEGTRTFTLIEPHGLIVANGNEKVAAKQTVGLTSTSSGSGLSSNPVQPQNNSSNVNPQPSKQGKMGSSTGNRQVDPTQPFRCEHCNSTFTRLGNFTRHKKIHTVPTKDGQRFKCDVCSKSFLQRCDLARHLHIHRGTEPHRCNICGKGYIRHSDLVTHQRFHNKEKPFGCPHCSKGFCQRGDLNRHLRSIHLQMKPILCPCCNRKFAKQETLLRHLNTAHKTKHDSSTSAVAAAAATAIITPSSTTTTATTDTNTTST